MVKHLYVVRHCKAAGQQPDAPLTAEGYAQAELLADFLSELRPERIISSPFRRAHQSVEPLARRLGLPIETDERLVERVLCGEPLPDWPERLRETFGDFDLCFEGGESSRAAMERAAAVVADALVNEAQRTVVVTHGNLMTLLLKRFDDRFGFEEWRTLTNPDVFRVLVTDVDVPVERIWQ